MGLRVVEYTIVTANTIEIFTTPINEETLQAVTLQLTETPIEPNVARGQIGVMSGGTTLNHRITVLADDYLDAFSCVSWTGWIHLPPHAFIFAAVISDTTRRFRLNVLLHDYIPPPLREVTRE